MLLNTPSSTSVTSRRSVRVTESEPPAAKPLLAFSITILLGYSRFIRIRTRRTNGVRSVSTFARSDAPEPGRPGASVLSIDLLAGFDHVGDQGIAVLAVLAHAVGRVRTVHERDDRDQAITGTRRNPIKTSIKSVVTAHPANRITNHATWYHIDCNAWNATRLDLSL